MVEWSNMILLPGNYWEIRNTLKKGRGVFAKRDIAPGTVIGDYIGKVLKTAQEDIYEKDEHLYLMYYHDQASIYPTDRKKPGIHLINHSCTPNSWMYTYKGHALFFAIRHIFAGEEITVSYLLSPYDDTCDPCTHACYCQTRFCTSTMHLPKDRYKKWKTFDEENGRKTKRERVRYGKDLPQLSSYPNRIVDHPIYTLFGSARKPSKRLNDKALPSITQLRKMLRETGRTLHFPKLNKRVLGVQDNEAIFAPKRWVSN